MQRIKRLIYLSILNILVSATTVVAVLNLWDSDSKRLGDQEISTQPGVTIVVVHSELEATAVMQTLIATESPTETAQPYSPTPSSVEYVVQEGDTLGTIAGLFSVSIYDILAINNLEDPNNLYIGQTIRIPTGPLPTLTRTFTPTPTAPSSSTPTPVGMLPPTTTPTPTLQPPSLIIESILGVGDLQIEKVRITLISGSALSLTGWRLVDSDNHIFIFPQLELFPQGSIQINSRAGIDTATDLFWGLASAVWETGETAQLLDETGKVHTTFQVP